LRRNICNVPAEQLLFGLDAKLEAPVLLGTVSSNEEYEAITCPTGSKGEDQAARKKEEKRIKDLKRLEKRRITMLHWAAGVRRARQLLGMGNKASAAEEVQGDEVDYNREKAVLVSIDVEAWEKDHSQVTEIGITTLDTAKIPLASELPRLTMADIDYENLDHSTKPPRTRADAICELIESRHLRVLENKSLTNGMFVSGCPEKFDFGTSEWVSLKNLPKILGDSLRFFDAKGNKRKVLIVGHDVGQDLDYLRVVGYDARNIKGLESIDTVSMYKAVFNKHDSPSLAKVLLDLHVVFWNLHNAGMSSRNLLDFGILTLNQETTQPTPFKL
jgi:hypothetical protein